MSEIVLTVPSLTCRLCAREISAALRDVPGVRTVVVDLHTTSVVACGDVAVESVRDAVTTAGHAVTDVHERRPDRPCVGHDRARHLDRAGSAGPHGEQP